jgi:transcription elongation factor GreA
MEKQYLSKERFEELSRELEGLKTVKRLEIADALKKSKEYGDLSENAEYAEAREEQTRVEARIFELEELLRKAEIIEEGRSNKSGAVHVGSKVTAKRGKEAIIFTIVGSSDAKPEERKISNSSPIGKALMGQMPGSKVKVKTPAGETEYEIVKVE